MEAKLLKEVEAHAVDLLAHKLDKNYTYHNLGHTQQVVQAVAEIGAHSGLNEAEISQLKIAAWFHDLGYLERYVGHEEDSIKMARDYLTQLSAPQETVELVGKLIESTILDLEPRSLLEQIMKDADLYNLAMPHAIEHSEEIRHEWKIFCDRNFSDEEWDVFNYDFFRDHSYYTPYAKSVLAPLKQENTRKLKKAIKKRKKQKVEENLSVVNLQLEQAENQVDKLKKKLKKAKKQRPDRGIETMFRTTYRTHINLSDLADNKANILLSINAIVISIIFTTVVENYQKFSFVLIPSFPIILVAMTTIVFAILATRPSINAGIFDRKDILAKKTNLLFFGNFYRMNLDDYMWGIDQMMQDADYLYGSMAKDIYFLGRVLAKKFQLLRIAYNVFMYGMVAAIFIFGLVFFLVSRGVIT